MKQECVALAEIRAPLSGQMFAAFSYHHMVLIPVQLFFNILHCFQNCWRGVVISSALATFQPNLLPLCSNNLKAEISRTGRNHCFELARLSLDVECYENNCIIWKVWQLVRVEILKGKEYFSLTLLENDKLSLAESKYFSLSVWSSAVLKTSVCSSRCWKVYFWCFPTHTCLLLKCLEKN